MQTKSQLAKENKFWYTDIERRKPAPFPGVYPTRWRLLLVTKDEVVFDYWGKPNPQLIPKILRLCGSVVGQVTMMEFDTLGSIRGLLRDTPFKNADPSCNWDNTTLTYYYYPFHIRRPFFLWKKRNYFKHIVLGGKGHYIYSPHESMKGEHSDSLTEYVAWLKTQNKSKKSTAKKSSKIPALYVQYAPVAEPLI